MSGASGLRSKFTRASGFSGMSMSMNLDTEIWAFVPSNLHRSREVALWEAIGCRVWLGGKPVLHGEQN